LIFSDGVFLIGSSEPAEIIFDVEIKAHNLVPRISSVIIKIKPIDSPYKPLHAFERFYDSIKTFDAKFSNPAGIQSA